MARAGQVIHGHDGLELEIATLEPELLVMESRSNGTGGLPPMHLHPSQAERFTVHEGTVRAIVDGSERTHTTGDTFEVPPDTPHTMAAQGPTIMRWEVRPALRTAEFFERLHGGDAATDPKAFLEEFSAEFRLAA
jgi:mannose-6-phosphate isomerase-like protein (cupin superfamily)